MGFDEMENYVNNALLQSMQRQYRPGQIQLYVIGVIEARANPPALEDKVDVVGLHVIRTDNESRGYIKFNECYRLTRGKPQVADSQWFGFDEAETINHVKAHLETLSMEVKSAMELHVE